MPPVLRCRQPGRFVYGTALLKRGKPLLLINYSRSLPGVMSSPLAESVAANRLSSHCRSCLTSGQAAFCHVYRGRMPQRPGRRHFI